MRIDADRYRTKVEAPVAELHVRSDDGRLMASERSPAAVHEAFAGLAAAIAGTGSKLRAVPTG